MMNSTFRLRPLALASAIVLACYVPVVHAETTSVEIRPGNTLSGIIAEQYPGYGNRPAIMQFILENNPQAFLNNDINRLIVGKTLNLPDAASIPAIEPPPPPPVPEKTAVTDPELQGKLLSLEQEREALNARISQLGTDKQQLETQLAKLQAAQTRLADLDQDKARLQQERDTLNQRIQELESTGQTQAAQIKTLETQVADLTAATKAPPAPAEDNQAALDQEALIQQLDAIESANVTLQADKETLQKERDDLNGKLTILQAEKTTLSEQSSKLETEKQQLNSKISELEARIADLSATAPTANTEGAGDDAQASMDQAAQDQEILIQQLDAIESANAQLQEDKTKLQQELQALQDQVKQLEAQPPAATGDTSAMPDEAAQDQEILIQQLDAIESANAQLQDEKTKLEQELTTTRQALETAKNDTSALDNLQQALDKAQQDLQLAKAAQANAELTKANLEKSGNRLWPWLAALFLLPAAWLLGRKSQVVPQPPTPAVVTVEAGSPDKVAAIPNADVPPEMAPLADDTAPGTVAYPAVAANDDNPEVAIKLDIVRAYLDLRDPASAQPILNEILREGGRQQRQEAREILSFLG